MLSITHQLVRRLEAAEAEDGAACVQAQTLLDPEAGATCEPFSSGYLLYVGAASPLTHVLGLGFNGAITKDDVARMETFYRTRGAPVTVDVCPFADFSLVELLSQRGYAVSEFANVMVRGVAPDERCSISRAHKPISRLWMAFRPVAGRWPSTMAWRHASVTVRCSPIGSGARIWL